MADKKKMAKLIRTSQEASKAKAQHILLTLTEENLIRIDGSAKFVEAMASNVGLFNDVKLMMLNNVAQPERCFLFYPVSKAPIPTIQHPLERFCQDQNYFDENAGHPRLREKWKPSSG